MSADDRMLRLDRQDDVLLITFDRPELHNALHPEQLRRLLEAVESAGQEPDLRLIVLTGAGSRAFSSGFDIKALKAADPAGKPPSSVLFEVTAALRGCPVPTLAAIRGHCIGAGLDLAISCDHRIATRDAHFALPAAKLGTVYEPRSLDRFQAVLGSGVSERLAVCGHDLDAFQALRVGLVDELVEPHRLLAAATGWVRGDAGTARAHKRIIDAVARRPRRDEAFWAPLDRLRERSVASTERARAIDDFIDAGGGPS